MNASAIAAAAMLTAAAVILYQRKQEQAANDAPFLSDADTFYSEYFAGAVDEAASLIDDLTGGTMKLSAMSKVTAADVSNANVQAFLQVIRRGEGTTDVDGYRRIFGGQLFTSFAAHPNVKVSKSGYTSTAAGAFQFLKSTWDETSRAMGLPDFSPVSQERGAVGRIAARGALEDIKAGRLDAAIRKCAKEWASLPYSPYGQPTISIATAASIFAGAGGITTA